MTKAHALPFASLCLALWVALLLMGCASKPAPDAHVLTAPTGLWTGQTNPDLTLDIQEGGFLKLTRGGQEILGKWEQAGENVIRVTLNEQTADAPYQRRDLNLSITLPGDTSPTEFTQM